MTRYVLKILVMIVIMSGHEAYADPSCHIHKVTQIPLRNIGNTISSPALIDGHPVSLMVDTGSEGSLVTPDALAHLKLHTDPHQRTVILGPDTHPHLVPNVLAQQLSLGAVNAHNISIPLGALPSFPTITPPLLGLVGMDILGRYDLELDLPHQQLTLWDVQVGSTLCPHPPLWSHLWLNLPAQRYNGRFLVPFTLDGHQGIALIDSGARTHIISTDFAHKIGVTESDLARDPGGKTQGLGLKESAYHWHRFRYVRIGTEEWSTPTLTVAAIHDHADMLIGADWFQTHRLWLSAATGRVFVQGVEGQ